MRLNKINKTLTAAIGKLILGILVFNTHHVVSQNKIIQNMSSTIIYNYSAKKDKNTKVPDNTYTFKVFTEPYEHIGSGTSVTKGIKWDAQDFFIPLGFDFKLYDKTNDTIILSEGSSLTFDNLTKDSLSSFAAPVLEDLCDAAFDPLKDKEGQKGGTSNIQYITEGSPGKRVCKIEVKDAGFYNEKTKGKNESKISFQVWLYEEDHSIEFRFGDMHISEPFENLFNGTDGFMSGLVNKLNLNSLEAESSNFLKGKSSAPEMKHLSNVLSDAVSPDMQKGTVYRFTYVPKSVTANKKQPELFMYPNPAKDKLFFSPVTDDLQGTHVVFYDSKGAEVFATRLSHMLDISHLSNGIYYVDVFNKENSNVISRKLVVQK